ncbi:hypothetical protein AA106_21905 [Photorhabdus laumondii subsp. laumondii]|nr:hypothetical protein AA106_21905 [Photorhabdus laumondii subsp. laumondii]
MSRELFQELLRELKGLEQRLKELDKRPDHLNIQHEDIRCLLILPGIGPLGALTLMMVLGDSTDFKNGRYFVSYLGWVPRGHSVCGGIFWQSGDVAINSPSILSL